MHVPSLLRDLAWDLVGPHGVIWCGLLVAKVGADEDQGHRDAKPEEAEGKQGPKRGCARGVLAPDHQVEDEKDAEDDAREEQGCLDGRVLPVLALHEAGISFPSRNRTCSLLHLGSTRESTLQTQQSIKE